MSNGKSGFCPTFKELISKCRFAKPIGNFLNEGIYKIVRENRRYDFIIYSKAVNNDEGQTNDNETSELRDLKIEKLGNKKQKSNFMNQT